MINVVHINIHYDDKREIVALEMKLKSFKDSNGKILDGHYLVATTSAAFFKTTLLSDEGRSLTITTNPKRSNIVNLYVNLKENRLTLEDIANFTNAFQTALDSTILFF